MRTNEILLIENVVAFVRQDPGADHRVAGLCSKAFMGETKFKAMFKEYTRHAFHEWLIEERMQYALRLLQVPGMNLKQISRKTGYRYQRNFGKAFKKRWKISPAAWRKRCLSATNEHFTH